MSLIIGDGAPSQGAAASAAKKFDWSSVNKAVKAIDPVLQTVLKTPPSPAAAVPVPAKKPHGSTSWLKILGYSAVAAGVVGLIVGIVRSERRR